MQISIAMPVYNGELYLHEALQSIKNQTQLPDELLISDDGSKDNSLGIVNHFAKTASFNVKVLQHKPSGITANYLNALGSTSGNVIIFCDQDDVWMANKIELTKLMFTDRPDVAIVSSDSAIVDHHLQPLGSTLRGGKRKSELLTKATNSGDDFLKFLKGMPLLAHTLAIRNCCKADVLSKPEKPSEWWFESWLAHVALCHGRLGLIPDALTLYRQHGAQQAGAPSMKSIAWTPGVSYYINRIEQLSYCRGLLLRDDPIPKFSESERKHRLQTLNNFIDFLEIRVDLRQSVRRRWTKSFIILFSGKYHRYSSGWLSFAKDFLSK